MIHFPKFSYGDNQMLGYLHNYHLPVAINIKNRTNSLKKIALSYLSISHGCDLVKIAPRKSFLCLKSAQILWVTVSIHFKLWHGEAILLSKSAQNTENIDAFMKMEARS